MTEANIIAALMLGLAGAGHCIGMCGGIASAIGVGTQRRRSLIFAYQLGRIASYSALGYFLGGAAGMVELPAWRMGLRVLAALMLIAMGLYTANWWLGLKYLERLGGRLWRPIQSASRNLIPTTRLPQAFMLGGIWGFLPCGLIYSALAWASARANATEAALLMFLFGIGTLPAMLTASLGAQWISQALKQTWVRQCIGIGLCGWGVFNLFTIVRHSMQ
jgi:sulfite exporter TauE/SafE